MVSLCNICHVQPDKMSRLKEVVVLGLLLISAVTTYGSVLEAQCRARCYTSLIHIAREESYRIACSASSICSSCVLPCSAEYKTLALCRSKCVTATELSWCHSSCEFLKLNHNTKRGQCPLLEDITGFGKACAETCSNDSQCDGPEKCCYNGCGHTCQQPIVDKSELPPKLRNPILLRENADNDTVTIRWDLRGKDKQQRGVILYIVQGRSRVALPPSARSSNDWMQLGITEHTEHIAELTRGMFYRFRIASVNQNGSMGFCRPSRPFRLTKAPEALGAPSNLHEGQSTINEANRINLRVMWEPPKSSDPIIRYKVYYSERLSSVSHIIGTITERMVTVGGDQHEVTLEGLHPGVRYFIQVQAVARFGDSRKRSAKTSVYIDTMDIFDSQDDPDILTPLQPPPNSGDRPGEPRDIRPDQPYWEDGKLKCSISWKKPKGFEATVNRFTIHWQPMGCANDHMNNTMMATTHDREFDIYNLMFDCQYRVSVVAVAVNQLAGPRATIRFYTPPCNELRVKGPEKPVCPTPLPDLPSRPENVSYIFRLGHNNITVYFVWHPPTLSLYPVIGYRVIWAEHREVQDPLFGEGFPLLRKAESRILPAMQRSFAIPNLKSGTRYRVQIQALTNVSGGALATEDLKTPKVEVNRKPMTGAPSPVSVTSSVIPQNPLGNNAVHTKDSSGHSGTTSWHATSRTAPCMVVVISCLALLVLR